MHTYFMSSRNSKNRSLLQSSDPLQSTDGGGIEATSSPTQFMETKIGTSQSLDTEVVFSHPAVVPVSDSKDLDVSEDDMVDFDNDLFMDLPPYGGKKKSTDAKGKGAAASGTSAFQKLKKNYDLQRKFHNEGAAKEPWSEGVLGEDGVMHLVHCRPCSLIRGKPIHMAPKWDTISKHGQREIHKKCMALFAARGPQSVGELIQGCSTAESKRKRVQFATMFQLLASERPMTEFEPRFELYEFLNIPELPRKHWTDGSGWIMAEHFYNFVK